MILRAAGTIYGAAAAWRRGWYAADPSRRRALAGPVVSIGNLAVGGSGKTPVAACVARTLCASGERPAILSRGYRRRRPEGGVVVVSDGERVLAGVDRAGDEPLMLARALPGVPVLVAADRHAAGTLAERQFAATVHVLDDGFQHLALWRDVDLLLVDTHVLEDRVLPEGRLRERLDAARAADALIVPAHEAGAVDRLRAALGVPAAFVVRRTLGDPVWLRGPAPPGSAAGAAAFAFTGIARPERFADDLAAAGWRVAGALSFPDHHDFTAADLVRVADQARNAGAAVVLTTDKDAARLDGRLPAGLPVGRVPLTAEIDPPFADWLNGRIRLARTRRTAPPTGQ